MKQLGFVLFYAPDKVFHMRPWMRFLKIFYSLNLFFNNFGTLNCYHEKKFFNYNSLRY